MEEELALLIERDEREGPCRATACTEKVDGVSARRGMLEKGGGAVLQESKEVNKADSHVERFEADGERKDHLHLSTAQAVAGAFAARHDAAAKHTAGGQPR